VVRTTLLMVAIIGTFTYEFSVVLPLFSEFTFRAGASGYAALTAAMGVGAALGGLYTAGRRSGTPRMLVVAAALFGGSVLLTAIAPTITLAMCSLVIVGFFSISFTSLANATLQLESAPEMQGRVMSLWTVAFLGTTPIGGPLMGAVGEHAGARSALAAGGLAALVAAALSLGSIRQRRRMPAHPCRIGDR
jgi:MFS family permease